MTSRRAMLLLPFLVAGCGGGTAMTSLPADHPKNVQRTDGTVVISTSDEFRFTPERIVVERGEQLHIELRQTGSYPHNLAVPALHVTSDTVTGDFGHETTRFTVDTSRVGTYRFICTFHDEAGMTGQLVVR